MTRKLSREWEERVKILNDRLDDIDSLYQNQFDESDEDVSAESDCSIMISGGNGDHSILCETSINSLIVECHDSTQGREFDRTFASFMQDGYESDTSTSKTSSPVNQREKDTLATSEERSYIDFKNIRTFSFPVRSMVVVIVPHPLTVSFDGMALIQVVSGQINILGCELKYCDQFTPIYSSRGLLPLDITTMETEKICSQLAKLRIVKERLLHIGIGSNTCRDILESCDNSSVIFALKKNYGATPIHFVRSVKPETLRFKTEVTLQLIGSEFNISPLQKDLQLDFSGTENVVEDILSYNYLTEDRSGKASKVFVRGGKGAGKSTLLRYLVNIALNGKKFVYFLDGDPGQTEFTPPGCVSLVRVSAPLLGPPFTHQLIPEKMFFVGSCSPKGIADEYLFCMESLYSYYKEHHSKVPLFVNTMGWTRDEGAILLQKVKTIVEPSHVIQIEKVAPDSECVSDMATDPDLEIRPNIEAIPDVEEYNYTLYRNSNPTARFEGYVSAPAKRDLAVLAYLGRCQKRYEKLSFNAMKSYRIAWKHLALHVLHDYVGNNHMLYALNATWVALCTVDKSIIVEYKDETWPKFLSREPIGSECHGFGFIRNIDTVKRNFYIITPEPPGVLRTVNALVRGDINIPVELYLNQETRNSGPIPYVMRKIEK